jgi:hypothetical protein
MAARIEEVVAWGFGGGDQEVLSIGEKRRGEAHWEFCR